jgi:hypothetical protein
MYRKLINISLPHMIPSEFEILKKKCENIYENFINTIIYQVIHLFR